MSRRRKETPRGQWLIEGRAGRLTGPAVQPSAHVADVARAHADDGANGAIPVPGACRVKSIFPVPAAGMGTRTARDAAGRVHPSMPMPHFEPWPGLPAGTGRAALGAMLPGALRAGALGLVAASFAGCATAPADMAKARWKVAPLLRMDPGPYTAEAAYAAGKDALIEGRPHSALVFFEQAVTMQPGHADAWNGRVVALGKLARLDEARRVAHQAIATGNSTAELHGNLGVLLWRAGQLDASREQLELAARMDPANTVWTVALARAGSASAQVASATPVAAADPAAKPAPALQATPIAQAAPVAQATPLVTAAPVTQAAATAQVSAVAQAAPLAPSAPVLQTTPADTAAPVVAQAEPAPQVAAPVVTASAPKALVSPLVVLKPSTEAMAMAAAAVMPEPAPITPLAPMLEAAAKASPAAAAPAQPVADVAPLSTSAARVAVVPMVSHWKRLGPGVLELRLDTGPLATVAAAAPADLPLPSVAVAPVPTPSPLAAEATPPAPVSVAVAGPFLKLDMTGVEVSNGAGRNGLAKGTADVLRTAGVQTRRITNHVNYKVRQTQVQYRTAADAPAARQLARTLAIPVSVMENPALRAGVNVRVVLGKDAAELAAHARPIIRTAFVTPEITTPKAV